MFRLPELLFTALVPHEQVLTLYRPTGSTELEHKYLYFCLLQRPIEKKVLGSLSEKEEVKCLFLEQF